MFIWSSFKFSDYLDTLFLSLFIAIYFQALILIGFVEKKIQFICASFKVVK
jgi:hypothetical protein